MDWSDLNSAQGSVIDGHRIGEIESPRRACTLCLNDRKPGLFWLLELDEALRAEIEAGLVPISHPSIASIRGAGILDATHGYLLTSELRGPTLDDLLEEGPIGKGRAVEILRSIAQAYIALHDRGYLLLDLRPTDIHVDASWNDRITLPPHPALVGAAIGRRHGGYCAPEIIYDTVDERADQFTLGVIGFELLTGTTPHNPEAPPGERTLFPPSPLGDVPHGLSVLVQRLLANAPSARYPTMSDVLRELEAMPGEDTENTYGHFTPILAHKRTLQPIYLNKLDDVSYDRLVDAEPTDEEEGDSILSFLLLLLLAWATAMGLSYAVFRMW